MILSLTTSATTSTVKTTDTEVVLMASILSSLLTDAGQKVTALKVEAPAGFAAEAIRYGTEHAKVKNLQHVAIVGWLAFTKEASIKNVEGYPKARTYTGAFYVAHAALELLGCKELKSFFKVPGAKEASTTVKTKICITG